MPVDASIYGQIAQPKQRNVLADYAQALQVSDAQQSQQLNRLKLDEYQRGVEDQNALRSALSAPDADPYNALLRLGKVKEANDFAKGQADVAKDKAAASKDAQSMKAQQYQFMANVLGDVKDQAGYEKAYQLASMFGMDMKGVPTAFDPQFVQQMSGAFTTQAQKWADQRAKEGQAITVRGQDLTAETARRGQDITVRGQNMVDARSREANTAGRVPAGYRQKPDGSLEFIPGGPADPNTAKRAAPTEFQGKAGMFGNRAAEADRIITSLEGQYSPAAVNAKQSAGRTPLVGGAMEAGANLLLSAEGQKAEQAQRDFVNAVLRLESGAAIGQSEFDNARKQYFPQPGDGADVIAQKARNRKLAIQGLMNNARPGAVDVPTGTAVAGAADNDPLGLRNGR